MIAWITTSGLVVLSALAQTAAAVPAAPPLVTSGPPAPPPIDLGVAQPLTSPASWVTSSDYPVAAMRAGENGTVGFRLTIDPSGRPVTCAITLSSHSAALDEATCRVVTQRAVFMPARDARGRLVESHYANSIHWTIPAGTPLPLPRTTIGGVPMFTSPFGATARMHQPRPVGDASNWITLEDYPPVAARARAEGTVGYRLDIDAQGKVSGCEVLSSSNSPLIDTATCRLIKQRAVFQPATDLEGKPTTGAYWGSMRWTLPETPDHPKPLHFRVSFTVDEAGEVHDCQFETPSGEGVKLAEALGRGCAGWMRFKPFTDAAGKPVRRRVTIAQDVATDGPAEEAKPPAGEGPALRTVPDYPGVRGG